MSETKREGYIRRIENALKSDFTEITHEVFFTKEGAREILELLKEQSEQKKGKWIYGEHEIAMCDGYRCSQCGFFIPWDYEHKFINFIKDYHWCPSCGADMKCVQ